MDFTTCFTFTCPDVFPKHDENVWFRGDTRDEDALVSKLESDYVQKLQQLSSDEGGRPIPGIGLGRPLPIPDVHIGTGVDLMASSISNPVDHRHEHDISDGGQVISSIEYGGTGSDIDFNEIEYNSVDEIDFTRYDFDYDLGPSRDSGMPSSFGSINVEDEEEDEDGDGSLNVW